MQEKLVIFLHAENLAQPSWVIVNDAQTYGKVEYGQPDELATLAVDREIVVLIPAADALLIAAELPKMPRSRMLQALPFALEEKLTDEVETLHFAAGVYQTEQRLPVGVMAKEKMATWLALLKEWQVQPHVLTSILFAVPYESEAWHVILHDNEAFVRIAPFEGFACDRQNLSHLINIALAEHQPMPMIIQVHNYTQTPCNLQISGIEIIEQSCEGSDFISDLALYASVATHINFLQGNYHSRKTRKLQQGKLVKAMIAMGVVWLFILFLYPAVSYFILKQHLQDLHQEIASIYKRNFPQATNIVAPKLRMQEKLQRVTSDLGQNRSLLLIAYVSKAMTQTDGIKLKKLDYQNSQLSVELMANTSEDLSAFMDVLIKQGLNVKQQNANLTGEKVNATLTIN